MPRGKSRFGSCACCQRAAAIVPPFPDEEECLVCTCSSETSAKLDFYEHVNRAWLQDETITIPAEYPRWGSFIKLVDDSLKNQIGLATQLVSSASGADEEKLAAIWHASMKRFEMWEAGDGSCAEVVGELARLASEFTDESMDSDDNGPFTLGLARYLSRCQVVGIPCPVVFGKEANLKDTENVVLDLSPGGLSMPSRDYYVDEKFSEQRSWFRQHLANVVGLLGAENFEDDFVNRVVRFETKLAQVTMKPDQSRQFDQYFTVTTLDELMSSVNSLNFLKEKSANYAANVVDDTDADKDVLTMEEWSVTDGDQAAMRTFWEQMISSMGLREVMTANYAKNYPTKDDAEEARYRMMVFDGDYFRRLLPLMLRKANRQDVRAYLQYQVVRSAREYSTKPVNEEFFDFFSRKLGGQKEQKTPEKRSVGLINRWAGELMGKIYVSRFFSEEDKQTVHGMVKEVIAIMENSLRNNDWLTEATKAKALQKLAKFVVKLGYPDKWKNFDALVFTPEDSLFAMSQKVNAFEHETEFLSKINSVKDKTKWEMNPQDVNAYFHPLNNEIVFPAAIMQPPFYHRSVADTDMDMSECGQAGNLLQAINFGGIGAVIAHEITHGYDDQGRKFDSDGNINDWWQEEDAALFKTKCALMAEQAETWTFEDVPEEGEAKVHRMNGELTMGENLADLGGMSLAFQALQKQSGELSKEQALAFFTSWGNIWKSKETKAWTIQALSTDPHAPCSFRGNLVKNIDEFHETFGVQEGDPMYLPPDKRVKMW